MGTEFTVIVSVRQHFGNEENYLKDVEPALPFVGPVKDFHFDCPDVDPGGEAVLMFQTRDVDHDRNIIHINPGTAEQPTVFGGIPVSPSKNTWNSNIMLIRPGVLQETNNLLHIESRNSSGGGDGDIDDFIIDNVVVLYKCRKRLRVEKNVVIQNTWFTGANLAPYEGYNGVISISGHWFLQQGTHGSDFAEFLSKTEQQIRDRLGTYLSQHPEVDRKTAAVIILDIEKPGAQDLHTHSASDQNAIVVAYKTRIAATRAVFPNAKLGLYGTLVPDPQGRADNAIYLARLAALVEAGKAGLYDEIDYLVPVLYVRFGCDNAESGPCDSHWSTLDEYTALGVTGSRQLRRSDGTRLPLLPLLSFRVINGNSAFHETLLMDLGVPDPVLATLGTQLSILADNGVQAVALWNGVDENVLENPNPSSRTVGDYFQALIGKP